MKQYGKRTKILAAAAVCLAVIIALSTLLGGPDSAAPGGLFPTAYALAVPSYPQMPQYPTDYRDEKGYDQWLKGVKAQRRDSSYAVGLEPAMQGLMQQLLRDNDGENALCSPLNIYMALGLLAECTDGDSREQILSLLGSEDVESLRQQANDLWNDTYRADGIMDRVLASALWLNEDLAFQQKTLDRLAESYYAAAFQGEMGSEDYNQALRDWLNSQTGGMLQEQIGALGMDRDTVLALTTTVYFKAKWTSGGFVEQNTAPGIFHGAKGDAECDMMHSSSTMNYYWGDRFTAVASSFESGEMRFILPDEGYTPEELLEDAQLLEFLSLPRAFDWENSKHMKVNRTIPKFDVATQTNLKPALQALGITSVFDPRNADFSAVTDQPAFASAATHGVRVKIDERGCEAAAYTMIAAPTSAPPQDWEEIDFTLDRPFLFVVTNNAGLPLFAGIVNQP